MRKPSTRKITASPAAAKPVATKPVTVGKRLPIESAASGVKVVSDVLPVAVAVAKPSGNITRTAATVAKQATNFGTLSDRDTAYLGFYRRLAAKQANGVLTVAAIVASNERPAHIGSNKPHDAGVIVRLTKAGILATATDGHSFTITPHGTSLKA